MKKNKGFTLVQLAVVLVVTGLIAGGIVAGDSMVTSATVSKQIKQLQEIEIAFTSFKEAYGTVPGDSPAFAAPGDGDGLIENVKTSNTAASPITGLATEERASFWKHMSDAGVLKEQYTNTDISVSPYVVTPGPGGTAPMSAVSKLGYISVFQITATSGGCTASTSSPRTFMLIRSVNSIFTGSHSIVPATIAAAIDMKLDDGLAMSCATSSNEGVGRSIYAPLVSCYNASYQYNTTASSKCALAVEFGATSKKQ